MNKIPAWAKGYLTVKNAWLLGTAICITVLVAMLFGGWSIRETKQELKSLKVEQKDLKRQSEELSKKVVADSLKIDSLESELRRKQVQRVKEIHTIHTIKEREVEKIKRPDISNDDIRKRFRSN
jgi:Tfp pilus assembly protein PilN